MSFRRPISRRLDELNCGPHGDRAMRPFSLYCRRFSRYVAWIGTGGDGVVVSGAVLYVFGHVRQALQRRRDVRAAVPRPCRHGRVVAHRPAVHLDADAGDAFRRLRADHASGDRLLSVRAVLPVHGATDGRREPRRPVARHETAGIGGVESIDHAASHGGEGGKLRRFPMAWHFPDGGGRLHSEQGGAADSVAKPVLGRHDVSGLCIF